ncbi:MAG: UDP-N-acetylmuramoyl-L-alanine--D-glutamate ligase [Patescibacteria group bacterium]|jgi:UDP-N-acetylmuramoylalanine--D-glutamate ligase|nr:UDP-N-acetylmuramoyl-L-alanine--D-glutamate ligase [Patescibacteria group bacterium]
MYLESNNIALLGLGKENLSLLTWLIKHSYQGNVCICDQRSQQELEKILFTKIKKKELKNKLSWRLGKMFNTNLEDFELLFRSPGWPLSCPGVQKAIKKDRLVSSPMEFFLANCPTSNTIGVTGSKGKGTTASIIYQILKDSGRDVFLGGNIGIAPFDFFDQLTTKSWLVLELSSFQLEDLKISPRYSVLTNLFKEHLAPADPLNPNYHTSYQQYLQAKLQIANNKENKYLVANQNLEKTLKKQKLAGKIIYFKRSNLKSNLQGNYNQDNIGAAVALSKILKIKNSVIENSIANFKNLEHRLEKVVGKKNINYFNNSFSTTPESTILDLQSFSSPIILIAGGADKGANFQNLGKAIAQKVKTLILLDGQATSRIKQAVLKNGFSDKKIIACSNMKTAVEQAQKKAKPGDIVLLSTACASFGLFKNYKERGEQFKYYVKKTS